jgi:hypothetical protein
VGEDALWVLVKAKNLLGAVCGSGCVRRACVMPIWMAESEPRFAKKDLDSVN